jgi:hypothetical protein
LGGDIQSEGLFDFDNMTSAVAKVVKVARRYAAAAVEIEQTHLALVENPRTRLEIILLQKLWVTVPPAADVEFVQVAVSLVEGGLDCEMKLSQMPGPGDDEASSDHRLDLGQRDPDLECIGFLVDHRMDGNGRGPGLDPPVGQTVSCRRTSWPPSPRLLNFRPTSFHPSTTPFL